MKVDAREIIFEPPLPQLQTQVMGVFDTLARALSSVPRVETQIPGLAPRIKGPYRVPPPDDLQVALLREQAAATVANSETALLKLSDSYAAFLPQLDEDVIRDLLLGDRGLKPLQAAIDNYRALCVAVAERSTDYVDCVIVTADVTGLKDAIAARAQDRIFRALDYIATVNRSMCVAACERLKAVADRASVRPTTSEDLMEVKAYVDGAAHIVEDILVEVARIRTQLLFLLDNAYNLSEPDVVLNSKTFLWPGRLGTGDSSLSRSVLADELSVVPLLDEARVRLSGQLEMFENDLRTRRETFEAVRTSVLFQFLKRRPHWGFCVDSIWSSSAAAWIRSRRSVRSTGCLLPWTKSTKCVSFFLLSLHL
jgi:hypothetical protein